MADEVKRTFDLADADYERAIGILVLHQKASTSYLQRTMRLGYNAAASLMERAEKEGFVSRATNTGKRDVLISLPELARLRASQADAGARAMVGAAIERAAQEAEDHGEPGFYQAMPDAFRNGWADAGQSIAIAIRALDPDATAALAEYVRPFKERAEKAESNAKDWSEEAQENLNNLVVEKAELMRLRDAMKPFGFLDEEYADLPDNYRVILQVVASAETIQECSVGDFRTIRALLEGSKPTALSSIKREAEDAGIKIGLRAGARVSDAHYADGDMGNPGHFVLALTTDEARKLGEDE